MFIYPLNYFTLKIIYLGLTELALMDPTTVVVPALAVKDDHPTSPTTVVDPAHVVKDVPQSPTTVVDPALAVKDVPQSPTTVVDPALAVKDVPRSHPTTTTATRVHLLPTLSYY